MIVKTLVVLSMASLTSVSWHSPAAVEGASTAYRSDSLVAGPKPSCLIAAEWAIANKSTLPRTLDAWSSAAKCVLRSWVIA